MNKSQEATASANINITDENGFPWQFTIRDDNPNELLKMMGLFSTWLKEHRYTPQVKKSFGEKKPLDIVPDKKCPTCGSDLIYQTYQGNKKFIKCSTQKYNPSDPKHPLGCPFTVWPQGDSLVAVI